MGGCWDWRSVSTQWTRRGRAGPSKTRRPGYGRRWKRSEWRTARVGAAPIAIGLSGQMHGLVCLDAAGEPLRPAIIWADQRSAAQVARVVREVGVERLGRWTGNPLATGFMLASWLWLREHEPETARRTATLLLPKDYLRLRLTGTLGAEPSDASSTLLFDTAASGSGAPICYRRWTSNLGYCRRSASRRMWRAGCAPWSRPPWGCPRVRRWCSAAATRRCRP